jgi:hypothetical protein
MKPEDSGRMLLISGHHFSPEGNLCRGTGRTIAVWPLRVELRAAADGYELRIGNGRPVSCATRDLLVAKLRELGVDRDEAQRRVALVEAGQPVAFEVRERRHGSRARGDGRN